MPSLFVAVANSFRDQLVKAGYRIDPAEAPDDVVLKYLGVRHRRIPARPRTVYIASGLVCPPTHQAAFDALRLKATSGGDLGPHLHDDRGVAEFNDDLLNDWDIHHLHLNTTFRKPGLIDRSGPVLFARVTTAEFYIITIMLHGRGHHPWSRQELIEILHQNWPVSIDHATVKGPPELPVVGLARSFTDDTVMKLRAAHINVSTQRADGTIHMPIGGGVTASGINFFVMREKDRIRMECDHKENAFRQKIAKLQGIEPDLLSLDWKLVGGSISAMDAISGTEYKLQGVRINIPALP